MPSMHQCFHLFYWNCNNEHVDRLLFEMPSEIDAPVASKNSTSHSESLCNGCGCCALIFSCLFQHPGSSVIRVPCNKGEDIWGQLSRSSLPFQQSAGEIIVNLQLALHHYIPLLVFSKLVPQSVELKKLQQIYTLLGSYTSRQECWFIVLPGYCHELNVCIYFRHLKNALLGY